MEMEVSDISKKNPSTEEYLRTIKKLQESNKKNEKKIRELESYIHEHITTKWSWSKIKVHFLSIENVVESSAFLDKILKEKAICSAKECPAFLGLGEIEDLIFKLIKQHGSIFDIKTARSTITNQKLYAQWEELYWKIRFKLMRAYQEIKTIGIPNENKMEKIERAHERELKTIDALGKARIPWSGKVAQHVDDGIEREKRILRSNDPELQKEYGLFHDEKDEEDRENEKKEMMNARIR